MKVIAGLGNPGRRYANTRHNIGFMALEAFSARLGNPTLRKKTTSFLREDYEYAGGILILLRPLLYMNLSGEALLRTNLNWAALAGETLVVYDEAELDFGRVRIRPSGSAGGHKGMGNIIAALGTQEIPRVRLGIGREPDTDLADHVLKPFTAEEKEALPDFLERAADAVQAVLDGGLQSAMNIYNTPPGIKPRGETP